MSILQKINTGGWDQNIVDELVTSSEEWFGDTVLAMLDRIEDTLDHDDLNMTIEDLNEKINTFEDEANQLEDQNELLTKQIGALKADAAEAKLHLNKAYDAHGKHRVT